MFDIIYVLEMVGVVAFAISGMIVARSKNMDPVGIFTIGLGIFSILGAQLALDLGHSWFIASLLGVMTGTFGGALRDTLCNEVPYIFRKDHIYASISFAGCWRYALISACNSPGNMAEHATEHNHPLASAIPVGNIAVFSPKP
ncbi:MAG: trimeric intracellular cation channel family protein [Marinobacter sp.]